MKKFIANIRSKFNALTTRAVVAVSNTKAEGYVDSGVKILIAVVIGALLLGLLYVVVVLFLRGGIAPYLVRLYHFVGAKLFPEGKGALIVKNAEAAGKEVK